MDTNKNESDSQTPLEPAADAEQPKLTLDQERKGLETKAAALRKSHAELTRRVQANIYVSNFDINKAVAEGRDADAEALRVEIGRLEAGLRNILFEAEACERRIEEIRQNREAGVRIVTDYNAIFMEAAEEMAKKPGGYVTLCGSRWP